MIITAAQKGKSDIDCICLIITAAQKEKSDIDCICLIITAAQKEKSDIDCICLIITAAQKEKSDIDYLLIITAAQKEKSDIDYCLIITAAQKEKTEMQAEQNDPHEQVLLCPEKIKSVTFPTYAPPNVKDDMVRHLLTLYKGTFRNYYWGGVVDLFFFDHQKIDSPSKNYPI